MKQLTKEEAIDFGDSGAWMEMSHSARAKFQLHQDLLCMPFDVFHEAVEKTLGRPVFIHEFGTEGSKGLREELEGIKDAPSLQEIIDMIPPEKRIVVCMEG